VNGLLTPDMFDARPFINSFEEPELIEVARRRVGNSVILGKIDFGASFRLTIPFAFRLRDDPSLLVVLGVKKGRQSCEGSSYD